MAAGAEVVVLAAAGAAAVAVAGVDSVAVPSAAVAAEENGDSGVIY